MTFSPVYNLVHTNGNDHHKRGLSVGYRYDIALTKLAGEKGSKNAPKSAADLLVAFKPKHKTLFGILTVVRGWTLFDEYFELQLWNIRSRAQTTLQRSQKMRLTEIIEFRI